MQRPSDLRSPIASTRSERARRGTSMQPMLTRSLLASATALALLAAVPALAQTLTIGTRAGPESVDPHYTASGTHAEALTHVFDTLVRSGDKPQLQPPP